MRKIVTIIKKIQTIMTTNFANFSKYEPGSAGFVFSLFVALFPIATALPILA
jgi:hypothetical protein